MAEAKMSPFDPAPPDYEIDTSHLRGHQVSSIAHPVI
jgi:hypothetical protein